MVVYAAVACRSSMRLESRDTTPWGVALLPGCQATPQKEAVVRAAMIDPDVPWGVRIAIVQLRKRFPGCELVVLEPEPLPPSAA